jgi:hypothetical protein
MFELSFENQLLSQENSSLVVRLASMEMQLRLTKSELYAQMHKNVHLHRQAKKYDDTILDLRKASDMFQSFLQSFPDVALVFKNYDSSRLCVDSATENTSMRLLSSSPSIGNANGRESDDIQYTTALQIILKTRQELRSYRKIAMFWKRKAKLSPEHADLVTPSPSEISEVQNALSKERKEAVAALQRRRQLMMASGTQLPPAHTCSFEQPKATAPTVLCPQTGYYEGHLKLDSTGQDGGEEWGH